MTLSDTPIRAVVPYVAPTNPPVSAIRTFLHSLSCAMDALFVRRKGIYLSALLFAAFGLLLGSYFVTVQQIHVELLLAVQAAQILLPVAFFTGVTLFGVLFAPACLLVFSFLCGCAFVQLPLSSAQGILCFALLLLLFLSILLFSVEAFLTARRAFAGWKALIFCRSFLAFCLLFLISFLLDRASELLLLSIPVIT